MAETKKARTSKEIKTVANEEEKTALIKKRLEEVSSRPIVLVLQTQESFKVIDHRLIDLKTAVRVAGLLEVVFDETLGDITAAACLDRATAYEAFYQAMDKGNIQNLVEFYGLGNRVAWVLRKMGYRQGLDLLGLETGEILKVQRCGEQTARRILLLQRCVGACHGK